MRAIGISSSGRKNAYSKLIGKMLGSILKNRSNR